MLKKIFDPVLRFFTVIASALTGITAVCTAVGFLAHRGHLKMLGISNIPVDLNQYMYTGAQFLAYLPFKLIFIIALNILDLARIYFLEFFLTLLALLVFYQLHRFKLIRQYSREFVSNIRQFVERRRTIFWGIILIGQFVAVHHLLKASSINSLLFVEKGAPPATSVNFSLLADKELLEYWIVSNTIDELLQFLGWLALIIIFTSIIMWKMIGTYRKNEIPTQNFWQTTWLGANLMLFCTQIILFPINYGILQLPNQYPQVEVVVDDAVSQDPAWPADEQLMLLDDQNGKYYLYSRSERRLWYIKESDIHSISYSGMTNIFQSVNLADSTSN